MRRVLMSEERDRRAREAFDVAEAARRERGEPHLFGPPPVLPDLAQVTGWSKASGKAPHHEGVALFGGWRVADNEGKGVRGNWRGLAASRPAFLLQARLLQARCEFADPLFLAIIIRSGQTADSRKQENRDASGAVEWTQIDGRRDGCRR